MNSWKRSLSAQLLLGALLSLLAAAVVFMLCFFLTGRVLDRTVYGLPFANQMADAQFQKLQGYVRSEQATPENLYALERWCALHEDMYLDVYLRGDILFSSDSAGGTPQADDFDISMEAPERENVLTLADGTKVSAFLYYCAGDAYYYGTIALSALLAFAAFAAVFIVLVHRKVRYIKQLKGELDILAGGDMGRAVTVRGTDELGELAEGMEQMRRAIAAQRDDEAQLRIANSELVTAMSHDLRTPLTSLLGYLELMERGRYDDAAQLHHFLERSMAKAQQIKDMADKLFAYFLVYAASWEQPELEDVDADEFLHQLWGDYVFALESGGFSVRSSFDRLDGLLRVNPELLRRTFDNLYGNLVKYADASQCVELCCRREGGQAVLTLTNTIAPHHDEVESTHIGLKTCQRVIAYHGGTFAAQARGDVFQVRMALPLTETTREAGG